MRKLTIGKLVVAFTMVLAVSTADAFWNSYGSYGSRGSYGGSASYGSSGSSGSYASHGSSSSYGSYASHGSSSSYGSHGGLIARIKARHASSGSYGSHGSSSSYGSHGVVTVSYGSNGSSSSYGSSGSYGSNASHGSYSSVGSSSAGSYGTVISESSSVVQPTYASSTATGSGTLSVNVPADAVVFVNGSRTTSTGTQRQYVSKGLAQGEDYAYEVRVEYELNGEKVVESKSATLTADASASLNFTASQPTPVTVAKAEATITKLTVRVPEGASITLAGAPTKQTGAEREFSTTRLANGQTWEDYRVQVELDGVVQQRTITLRGGDSQELVFNFGGDQIAAK
ncbi:hypothetical protein Pla175_17300 [Pirellulimonas nuda]|uniref:TIGR03000 domain-containing protein n=1 Tax=Pirellulimonas nuda TaxID=2528009 RepID=A0A518DA46_9BACT|nr:TIGR03000 domain-containing protein [Pirellulimonas nuda]QDU88355.1 hypothetical protein Pla175_17300 [Pirellulimonas nuda]